LHWGWGGGEAVGNWRWTIPFSLEVKIASCYAFTLPQEFVA
jgi:hypothetical protein